MGAAHVRPYYAAHGNAVIAAMLDFTLRDSAREHFPPDWTVGSAGSR